ncbi:MAG TPA: SURF1 family protein [Casimicrobiaceae bacterium]
MALPNAVRAFFALRRFRPGRWPTLATIAFVAVAIALGNWQRGRAAEKQRFAAELAAAAREPPAALPLRDEEATRLRFRLVRASGEYDAGRQIFIDNKVHGGRAGFDVVAPLKLAGSGRYVLVDRGWIAQGARRADLPVVPPPAGTVTVVGRVNLPPQYLELARERAAGPLWENLDVGRIAAATGLDLLPVVLEQTDPVAPADALLRDWPAPDVGATQNVSYMLQWYSFAALAVILWLTLNWRLRADDHARSA